jgi:hypothetical protein
MSTSLSLRRADMFMPLAPSGLRRSLSWTIFSLTVLAGFLMNPARSLAGPPPLGEPFYCMPNEGAAAIIVNGGTGVFTVSSDCYNNVAPNANEITVGPVHGTFTPSASGLVYTYTPSPLNYTGTDTFTLAVTTSANGSAGGPGDFAGGAGTIVITLNVIPASTTLVAFSGSSVLVPIPPGSISGCPVSPVNGGLGPPSGTIYGCITAVAAGTVLPSHGTLAVSGSTIRYTPVFGYVGADTFAYQAQGIDDDGPRALASGNVTVAVTVDPQPTPTLSEWAMIALAFLMAGTGYLRLMRAGGASAHYLP